MRGLSAVLTSMNGVLVVYVMGLVNAVLALVVSFGVHLNETQQGTIVATVNALMILVAHATHSNAKRTKQVIPSPPLDYSHVTQAEMQHPPQA